MNCCRLHSRILISFCVIITAVESFGPKSGPYDIILEKVTGCADEGTQQIQFQKKFRSAGNGKLLLNEEIYVGVPVDENFKIHVELQKWGNGGYRPRFMQHTAKTCKTMWKLVPELIKSWLKAANIPYDEDPCPLPAGNYSLKNWEVGLELGVIPTMIYDKYRAVAPYYYKDIKVGCVMIYGEAVPKSSTG
uniref:MD-2-related lipid-recognition domain-containing protein n=1 Tax=Graphocephala atropunctata TaxID=36148 RepID=A0A1B6L3I0_9HEMI